MNNIQIFCDSADIEANGKDSVSVYLKNVDIGQIVGEFNHRELVEQLDYSDVMDYVTERQNDGE